MKNTHSFKIIDLVELLLFIIAIVFIFFNWKISIIFFLTGSIIHTVPKGPNQLLNLLSGLLIISGVIYLFIDWRIGVVLIIGSLLVTKFRLYGNKLNHKYYHKK